MRTGTDSNNIQQNTHALLSSAEYMRQTLYNGLERVRGGFTNHHFFKTLSEIKIDPKTAERLAFMGRK